MTTLISASGFDYIEGTPEFEVTPPLVPIPDLWPGMQYYIVPDLPDGYSHQLFPADHANPFWRNKYGVTMLDAANRLRWTAPDGVHNFATTVQVTGVNTGFPLLSTSLADKINGRAVLTTSSRAHYLSIPGFGVSAATGPDLVANAALYTPSYTYVFVFRAAPGAVGGLFGQSDGTEHTSPQCGHRFGFPTGGNGSTMIYQHFGGSDANLLTINRNVANSKPVLAVIRFDATSRNGEITIVNDGTTSAHAFSFPDDVSTTAPTHPWMLFGYLNSVSAASKRDFSLVGRWNRSLNDMENDQLLEHSKAYYGPF